MSDKTITITIPLTTPRPSSSGKTLLVGTFNGHVDTTVDGKPVRVTASATIKPD